MVKDLYDNIINEMVDNHLIAKKIRVIILMSYKCIGSLVLIQLFHIMQMHSIMQL